MELEHSAPVNFLIWIMQKQNILRIFLFVVFFSIGAATISLSILSNDLLGYYQNKKLLKEANITLDRLISLNADYDAVYNMIEQLGPCHNNRILEALQQAQKRMAVKDRRATVWVSNNVWNRVNELINKLGLVRDLGRHKGVWQGRNVSFNFRKIVGDMAQVGDTQESAGWERLPLVEKKTRPVVAEGNFVDRTRKKAFSRVGVEQQLALF